MSADMSSTERRSEPDRTPAGFRSCLGLPVLIAASAMLLGWLSLGQVDPIDTKTWAAFGLIAVGAALAQLFPVVTPRDQSYHTTMVVLVPAALLLPMWLLPAVVVAQHVPGVAEGSLPLVHPDVQREQLPPRPVRGGRGGQVPPPRRTA